MDRLRYDNAKGIRDHLLAAPDYQRKSVRFLENHDEDRAAAALGQEKSKAAAVITGTLTTEQLALLEELHQEKGLGGLDWPGTGTPMDVSAVHRTVPGQWYQTIEADTPETGTVRVRRVS